MANLTRYVHYAMGVINFDIKNHSDLGDLMEEMVKFCDSYSKITKYYLIAHDETDVPHIHFIFYSVSQVQLMTYYNKLRNRFVPNFTRDEFGINLEKCESINAHLRYLLHQDNKSIEQGKKRYEVDDFVSNDDVDIIDSLVHSRKGCIDVYMLRDAVLDSANPFELMARLTLPVYHRYANEIRTLLEMRPTLVLMREQEKQEKEDLPF